MATLLMTRVLPQAVIDEARKYFDLAVREEVVPMTPVEMRAALAGFDAVLPTLGDPLGAVAFEGDLRCRMLANFGVGYNHIDVAAARAAGLVVSNTPGAVTDATADIAVMLMLMAARRASEGEALVRSGGWLGWHPTQLLGLHVSGKTLGVIGMGRIGQAVARRSHFGFGMEVVYYNRSPRDSGIAGARQMGSIADVMAAADVVSICLPGGADTFHIIDEAALARMRPHAVLVNTARGEVVDQAALIAALAQGRIAGAGLDVYEDEPAVPQALRELANVTLLPHLGTNSLEVRSQMGMMAVENLRAFFAGEPVPNRL
jgi:hydroxypyruvate reductase